LFLEYFLKAGHLSMCRGGLRNFNLRGFSELAVACIAWSQEQRSFNPDPFQENSMGILSSIFSKIFPSSHPAQNDAPTAAAADTKAVSDQTSPLVDVAEVLNDMAAKNPQKLDWSSSIVDLMKLLDLDSSLAARKELAAELSYQGDIGDSATMNIWLHRQVMTRFAENGGKVPAELKS